MEGMSASRRSRVRFQLGGRLSTLRILLLALGLTLACGGRGNDVLLRAATGAECAEGGVVLVSDNGSSVMCDSDVAVSAEQDACNDTRDQIMQALEDLVESGAVDASTVPCGEGTSVEGSSGEGSIASGMASFDPRLPAERVDQIVADFADACALFASCSSR